ncbi:hypothetical membrane protein [Corynebacterium kutscheri]|uniref:Flp pilus assembly protein TadB n=1 Tax=Corynebacterium kutscheri TaxID=35755 RepID=A0A0F6TCW3_9CORY|nr:type II secretion system F family protein [Corynebacterium kutscheri]AKE40424.1 Flp pilus assembly protein TadB [Corynebacterium kutscheri]VEH05231.1 hypothetical membrane protein [Corynebacterium kutscheri]VEH10819.1 hypothetical membrane protein [Corynebacterium kutscheri]VEH80702.1 hypothetical membrane protein [Corynebacterium kutscheri]
MTALILLSVAFLINLHPAHRLGLTQPRCRLGFIFGGVILLYCATTLALPRITNSIGVLVAFSLAAATIGYSVYKTRLTKMRLTHQHAIAQLVSLLIGELHSGNDMAHALGNIASELKNTTLSKAVRVASTSARSGSSGAKELHAYARYFPELEPLARSWLIAEQHGMSQLGLLTQIQKRIDAELRHHARTKAALQGARLSALILAALPLVGVLMGSAMGLNVLVFLASGLGSVLLIIGVGLMCAGFLWSQRIINGAMP